MTSEPSLCVPVRPTPQLGAEAVDAAAPTRLRKDFLLSPRERVLGHRPIRWTRWATSQDVAIGLSRTLPRSRRLPRLQLGHAVPRDRRRAVPQLNAGTLSVIVGSLGNIIEDRKAPLDAGAASADAADVHRRRRRHDRSAAAHRHQRHAHRLLRVDRGALRAPLTSALDINVGVNLTVTKDANSKPAIQPMLVGVDASERHHPRQQHRPLCRRRRRRSRRCSRRSSTSPPARSAASSSRSRCRRWPASASTT